MKVGFGHLRHNSKSFWELSLREWQAALKGYIQKEYGDQKPPMTSSSLNKLMEKYPDDR